LLEQNKDEAVEIMREVLFWKTLACVVLFFSHLLVYATVFLIPQDIVSFIIFSMMILQLSYYTCVSQDTMLNVFTTWMINSNIGEINHMHKWHEPPSVRPILGGVPVDKSLNPIVQYHEVAWAFPRAFKLIHDELFVVRCVYVTVSSLFGLFFLLYQTNITMTFREILVIPYVLVYLVLYCFYIVFDYIMFYPKNSPVYQYKINK